MKRGARWLILCPGTRLSLEPAAQGDESFGAVLPQRHPLHLPADCLHTFEELTTVWEDGFHLDTSIVYKPWLHVGLELGGTLEYTGMTGEMKNEVLSCEPTSEHNRIRKSSGGGLRAVSLGPRSTGSW